jgi:hypothetical protein
MDPADWRIAYAVDNTHVYRTTEAGAEWTDITGQLVTNNLNNGLRSVALIKQGAGGPATDVLLVGGQQGVFSTPISAGSANTSWSPFSSGLPNVAVTQLVYIQANNVLLASTLGQGIWMVSGIDTKLTSNNLTITGGAQDTITLSLDAANSALLDVVANGKIVNVSNLAEINGITLNGGPKLSIDSRVRLPGKITYNGPASNLTFLGSARTIATDASSGTIVIDPAGGVLTVQIPNNGGALPANLPQENNQDVNVILADTRAGLEQLADERLDPEPGSSRPGAALQTGGVTELADIDVADAFDFDPSPPFKAVADPDSGPMPAAGSDTASQIGFLGLLFGTVSGAFDMGQIGYSINTLNSLQKYLAGLSDPGQPNRVTYTQDPVTGDVRFDVTITKTLTGQTQLALSALGGTVDVNGTLDISALVHVHFVFGVDSQGFYIDTRGNSDPEIVFSNIKVVPDDNFDVGGDFGFFDISVNSLTVTLASGVELDVTLNAPAIDPITGATDGKLRIYEYGSIADLATSTVTGGNQMQADAVVAANLSLDSGLLGSIIPPSLSSFNLTFTIQDVNNPTDVTIGGDNFRSIGDLINQSKADILTGLQQLATLGHQIDASPAMAAQLPVIDQSLGSYVQVGALFDEGLYQPVKAYFDSLGTDLPTVSGLLGAVIGASGTDGDLSLSLAPGLDLSMENGALLLSYAFTATRTDPIALDLGLGGASPLSLNTNVAVQLQTTFSFDSSIGVDLVKLLSGDTADAFFFQLNTAPTINASFLDAGQGLSINANIGALQVGGQVLGLANTDGTRRPLLTASVSLGLAHDSSGRTTLAALRSTAASQLIIPSATGSLGLDIPITASLHIPGLDYNFASGGTPELTIVDTNLFSGAAPTITTKNFATLLSFQNLSASTLLLALDQLSSYLGQFANSPAFSTPIPFTKGTSLGSLVNLAAAYANELSGLTAPSGGASFSSVHDLAQVNQDTGTDPITFGFNPSFPVSQTATAPALTLTFNFTDLFGGTTGNQLRGNNLNPVIDASTPLADLNGGRGVQFSTTGGPDLRVALSDGTVLPVAFQNPTTVGDVITQIEDAPGNDGKLAAAINADRNGLVLTDLTLGSSLFSVIGQQGSGAAKGLGLVGIGFGNPVLDPTTPLSHLNNGAGVSFSTTGGNDLQVTLADGSKFSIKFNNPTTVGDLISRVAAARDDNGQANDGRLTLGLNAAGTGLALFDTSGSGGLTVQAVGGSQAAAGLGLIGSASAAPTITAGTLLSQLNGGQGVAFSATGAPGLTVQFADGTALNIAFTNPLTVGDLIDQINGATANNGKIEAAINAAGNGLVLTAAQAFTVAGTTTATGLGLGGSSNGNILNGRNINPAVLNGLDLHLLLLKFNGQVLDRITDPSTPLSDLKAGAGVSFLGDAGNDLEIGTHNGKLIESTSARTRQSDR